MMKGSKDRLDGQDHIIGLKGEKSMLWVEKLKNDVRGILKDHPVSICLFLAGCIGFGVYTDISSSALVQAIYYFFYAFTPCFVFLESMFAYKVKNSKAKMIALVFAVISLALSLSFAYFCGYRDGEAASEANRFHVFYICIMRGLAVYASGSALGSIYYMYKRSGFSFEKYLVRAFLGVMKAGLLYGVVAAGLAIVIYVFDTLIHEADYVVLIEMIVAGAVGFPAFLIGVSRVSEGILKFSRILCGYVLPGIVAAACLIVYAYIIKIIVRWTMPSNQAFAIMTSIFVSGLFIWTAAQGCTEGTVNRYLKLFPLFFAPFIILQIISLSMRIVQYGLTTSRYMGVLLIIFEIVYVTYYLIQLRKGEGVKGALFNMLFACILIAVAVPGINVFSAVTLSQKTIVEKYLSEVSSGTPSDASLARARSALRAIRDEGSLEGEKYTASLKGKCAEDIMEKLDSYSGYEEDKSLYISVNNSEPVIDVRDYSYMKPVALSIYEDDIDIHKVPICQNYDESKCLAYADLTDVITKLKELEKSGAEEERKEEVIEVPVILDDGSVFYITGIDFTVNSEGSLRDIYYTGYYFER